MSEKIESLISEKALAEFARLKELAESNRDSFEKLIASGVQLNNALARANTFKEVLQGSKDLSENEKALTKQMEELTKANQKLEKAYEEQAKKLADLSAKMGQTAAAGGRVGDEFQNVGAKMDKGFTKSFAQAVDKVVSLTDKLKQNKAAQKDLEAQKSAFAKQDQELPEVKKGLEDIAIKQRELVAEEKVLKSAITDTNKEIRDRIKGNNAGDGTREQIKQQIAGLVNERDFTLNINTAEGVARLNEINEEIDRLNKILEQTSDKLGKRKINIGNYEGAARIIVDAFEKAQRKVESTEKALGKASPEAQAARRELEGLSRVTESPQFLNVAAKVGDATAETRFFTKALMEVERTAGRDSEVASLLRQRLAELTDEIGDTRAEIKALSSDTRSFDLFASAVSFVASAFKAAAGAAVAFGASEEDAEEATKNLVAIENIANGVKEIANELTEKGTFANKVYTFAQGQVAIAMDSTATAAARLKAAFITLGIGALIIGVGLLIANLDKLKDAMSFLSKEQKLINELNRQAIAGYVEEKVEVGLLVAEIKDENTTKNRKKEIIKELNEISPTYFGGIKTEKDLVEKLPAAYDKYNRAIILSAKIKAAQSALQANEEKRLNKELDIQEKVAERIRQFQGSSAIEFQIKNDPVLKELSDDLSDVTKEYDDNAKAITAFVLSSRSALDKLGGDPHKALDESARKDLQAALEILKRRLQVEADFQKQLSELELLSTNDRMKARQKAFDLEKKIILAQQAFDVTEKDLTAKQIENINDEAKKNTIKKADETYVELLNIYLNYRQRQKEEQEKFIQEGLAMADQVKGKTPIETLIDKEEDAFERRRANLEESRDIMIASFQKERNEKILAAKGDDERLRIEKEFNRKRVEEEMETSRLILLAAIETAEKKLQLVKKTSNENEINKLLAQIAELKRQLAELKGAKIDIKTDESVAKLEKLKSGIESIGGKIMETFTAIGDLLGANIDREKNAIQDQIDALEKKKAAEIEAVNAQTLSEEEKANKIAIINARAQTQREALERRQRQLDLQRARFDKAKNVADAITKGAVAVLDGLIKGGPALAAVYGAIAAIQIAAAIAAPIPKFAHGTGDAPGGPSLVGDAFKKELVVTPDGRLIETPATPTVMNIPKHSVVYPDSKEILEAGLFTGMRSMPSLVDHRAYYKEMTSTLGGKIDNLGKIIKNKSEVHIHKSREGWGVMRRRGGNQQRFLNKNLQ